MGQRGGVVLSRPFIPGCCRPRTSGRPRRCSFQDAEARPGLAWRGEARRGLARQGRRGLAWHGMAGRGEAGMVHPFDRGASVEHRLPAGGVPIARRCPVRRDNLHIVGLGGHPAAAVIRRGGAW